MFGSKLNPFIPSIFITLSIVLATAFFFLKKGNKQISVKVFIVYSLLTILIFGLIGLTSLLNFERPAHQFILCQVICFVLGSLHTLTLYKLNSWSDRESFWHEFVFTLFVAMLGAFAFLFVFSIFDQRGFALLFASTVFFFTIPFLLLKTADFAVLIPHPEYQKWFYPIDQKDLEIPDELLDDRNVIVLKFQIDGNPETPSAVFKPQSKAILKLEYGKFFALFLSEYNDTNPGSQIKFTDQYNQPTGWNFYIKPKWWQSRKYINPDLTIRENGINDMDVIIAERV